MPPIRKLALALSVALLALVAATPADAAPRRLTVGASESASLVPDPVLAKTRMDLAVLAGFNEIEVRARWSPGKTLRRTSSRRSRRARWRRSSTRFGW
jgi:hypothetical protein